MRQRTITVSGFVWFYQIQGKISTYSHWIIFQFYSFITVVDTKDDLLETCICCRKLSTESFKRIKFNEQDGFTWFVIMNLHNILHKY